MEDRTVPGSMVFARFQMVRGGTIKFRGVKLRDRSAFICSEDSRDTVFDQENNLLRHLFRLCVACQDEGAVSVVVELPDLVHKGNFFTRAFWGDGAKWTLDQWATFLRKQGVWGADSSALTIPVLVVLDAAGREMRCTQAFKDIVIRVNNSQHVNGTVQMLPRLLDVLAPFLNELKGCSESKSIVDLCSRVDEGLLDEMETKSLLQRSAAARNFPLYLRLAVEISNSLYKKHAAVVQHPPWILELLGALLQEHVTTYRWTEDSVATLNSPIAQPVVIFLRNVVEGQILFGVLRVHDLVPIQHLYTLCAAAPYAAKWSFAMTLFANAKRSGYSIRTQISNLRDAVAELQSFDRNAFGVADYDAVLSNCASAVTNLEDLSQLLAVGSIYPRPACGGLQLRTILKQLIDRCPNACELGVVWSSFRVAFAGEAHGVFAALLSERLLSGSFPPFEVAAWLKSSAYRELCTPTAENLLGYLRGSSCLKDQLRDFADLFAVVEGTVRNAEGVGNAGGVGNYLRKDSTHWCAVVSLLGHPTLQRHAGTVLDVLSDHTMVPDGNLFHAAIGKLPMTKFVSKVLDVAVTKLLQEMQLGAPRRKLLDVKLMGASPVQKAFWARCARYCAEQSHLLSHFCDIRSLVQALQSWNLGTKATDSLLCGWLLLTRKLKNKCADNDEADAVVAAYLLPLHAAYTKLFSSDAALGDASYAQLEVLWQNEAFFSLLDEQFVLSEGMGRLALRRIDTRRREVGACVDAIQSQRPFLNALRGFIPHLVCALDSEARFDAEEAEVVRESGLVLEERSVAVRRFALNFPEQDRALLEWFVVGSSQCAASRSVLFKNFMAEQQQREGGWGDLPAFTASIAAVHVHLLRLLQEHEPQLTFDEIMAVGTVLHDEDRRPDQELQLLANFFLHGSLSPAVHETLTTVLEL
ncbi:hypothetical protein B484DRAFT_483373, partial [Ochromonadaceae sp. CCMP2298]